MFVLLKCCVGTICFDWDEVVREGLKASCKALSVDWLWVQLCRTFGSIEIVIG
jgi:hypothetical protein